MSHKSIGLNGLLQRWLYRTFTPTFKASAILRAVGAEILESILNLLFRNNAKIVVCGDINVNYLTNNIKKRKMDLLLASFNLVSTVNFPTQLQNNSATAIDNIFIDESLQGNYVIYPLCNDFLIMMSN
jgi:hypothetical protein